MKRLQTLGGDSSGPPPNPLSPRWGYEFPEHFSQGLTPLAIDCRPFGPGNTPIKLPEEPILLATISVY